MRYDTEWERGSVARRTDEYSERLHVAENREWVIAIRDREWGYKRRSASISENARKSGWDREGDVSEDKRCEGEQNRYSK